MTRTTLNLNPQGPSLDDHGLNHIRMPKPKNRLQQLSFPKNSTTRSRVCARQHGVLFEKLKLARKYRVCRLQGLGLKLERKVASLRLWILHHRLRFRKVAPTLWTNMHMSYVSQRRLRFRKVAQTLRACICDLMSLEKSRFRKVVKHCIHAYVSS